MSTSTSPRNRSSGTRRCTGCPTNHPSGQAGRATAAATHDRPGVLATESEQHQRHHAGDGEQGGGGRPEGALGGPAGLQQQHDGRAADADRGVEHTAERTRRPRRPSEVGARWRPPRGQATAAVTGPPPRWPRVSGSSATASSTSSPSGIPTSEPGQEPTGDRPVGVGPVAHGHAAVGQQPDDAPRAPRPPSGPRTVAMRGTVTSANPNPDRALSAEPANTATATSARAAGRRAHAGEVSPCGR